MTELNLTFATPVWTSIIPKHKEINEKILFSENKKAEKIDKVIPDTLDSKIAAAAKVGVGVAIPMIAPKGKFDTLLAGVGMGVAAEGVVSLLKEFGVVSGIAGIGSGDTMRMIIAPDDKFIGSAASEIAQSSSGTFPIVSGVGEVADDGTVFTDGNYDQVPIISGLDEEGSDW